MPKRQKNQRIRR